MIRDLTGQTAYQQRKAQFASAWGDKDLSHQERALHFWQRLGPAMVANLVIFVACSGVSLELLSFVVAIALFHLSHGNHAHSQYCRTCTRARQ